MRILHVVRQYFPSIGGMENFVHNLSKNLIERGHQCSVVTLNRIFLRDQILPKEEIIKGVRVFRIPFLGTKRLFVAPSIANYIRDHDIIHIHGIDFFVDFLSATKAFHKKLLVVSTHGGYFHTKKYWMLKRLFFNTITRFTLRKAAVVICDSRHDKEIFSRISDNVLLINNGIDYFEYSCIKKTVEKGLLIHIGRLSSNKNLGDLIKTVAPLKKEHPYVRLVIIGQDQDNIRSYLEGIALKLGSNENIFFATDVSDGELKNYLAKAHFFVSASSYESFCLSLLEAMSSGTVPIVNSIDPFNYFIRDGENGFLVDFSVPEKAFQTIDLALRLDLQKLYSMGLKAKNEAEKYSWDKTIKEFEKVYKEVANRDC